MQNKGQAMQSKLFIGYFNLPNALTFGGLCAAVLACLLSFSGKFEFAVVCLIAAGLLDLFDGFVARKVTLSEEERHFGVQIDSIVDMACFGVAPIVVALHAGLSSTLDYGLFLLYVCCAAMRLAFFNLTAVPTKTPPKYYTGLPVTYAALFFPLAFIALGTFDDQLAKAIIRTAVIILSVLFVLRVPVPKPRGIWYIIFPLLALFLSSYWIMRSVQPSLVIFGD